MSRSVLILTAAAVVAGGVMPAKDGVAREAAAPQLQPEVLQAEYLGMSPSLNELMALTRPPARGLPPAAVEQEVPNRLVPDFLYDMQNVDAPARAPFPPITGQAPAADLSFGGYDSDDNAANFGFRLAPPDTEGDVGRTHYVQWNNLGFKVFLKDGTEVTPPNGLPGNIFWQGVGGDHPCKISNNGDPIVLYDHVAGRWFFTQFDIDSGLGLQCTAISAGEDPLAGPYKLWALPVGRQGFNDYPKVGLWTTADGSQSSYHFTTNEFGAGFLGAQMMAWDRDALLNENFANGFYILLPPAEPTVRFSLQPGHLEGPVLPPAGTCETYIQAVDTETWGPEGAPDGYQTWQFCVDWDNVIASVAELPFIEAGFEFDGNLCGYGACIPQPGTNQLLAPLGQFTMYRFAVRMVQGNLTGVVSHTVDLGGDLAGSQWVRLDMNPVPAVLADIGQLNVGDGQHRWMSSVALDRHGNMGIGYSKSSETTFPSVYFTGRKASDPPGTLRSESTCIDGTGVQTNTSRWGDYSTISIDPVDDCTFWVTNEYVETTGSFDWDTQICSFRFEDCTLQKNLVAGNDLDTNGIPDRVVEVGQDFFSAQYVFNIDYFGPPVQIRDIVPQDWRAEFVGGNTWCDVVRADNRRNLFSDNYISCDTGGGPSFMFFEAVADCGPTGLNCPPQECGAFILNEGAAAYVGRTLVEGPTAPICLAAVADLNGGGLVYDGTGDEDGDGVDDYTEACVNFTDPCVNEGIVPECGDCLTTGHGAGCEVPICEAEICGIDPYCCDTEWDEICVGEAQVFCVPDLCTAPPGPITLDPDYVRPTGGR